MRLIPALFLVAISVTLLGACGSPQDRAEFHLTRAQELFEEGDYVTAKLEAMNAAQIEPKDVEVRFLLAKIEKRFQNHREAVMHLQVIVEVAPSNLEGRLKLGNYYVLARAPDEASDQVEVAMKLAPDNAEVRLLNARVYHLKKEPDQAKNEVDIALDLDPRLTDAIMFKVGLQHNDGDWDGALTAIDEGIRAFGAVNARELREFRVRMLSASKKDRAVEEALKALMRDFPDIDNYPISLSNLYALAGRIDEAEELLRTVVTKYPDDIDHRVTLIRFVADKRGTEQAIEEMKRFISESSDNLRLRLTLGYLYERAELFEDALIVYRDMASESPISEEGFDARNRIAFIKIAQGETEDVREMINGILADKKDNSEALLARAAYYIAEGVYDDAIADLRIVLRSDEKSERALLLLARSHVADGSPGLAQDAYRRLLEINPRHPSASAELAELYMRRGELQMAQKILRDQLEINPEDRNAADRLIQTLLFQDDTESAETIARKMLEFEDTTGFSEFQLGRIMQIKGSDEEAIAAYGLALEKNPKAVLALEGLVSVWVESERADDAIDYLDAHLAKYPAQLPVKFLLGSVYATKDNLQVAEKYFEEVIAGQPDGIRAYRALAGLYAEDPRKVVSIYRRGFEASPESEDMGLLLATAYNRRGQHEDAIATFKSVLEINPNNIRAVNNLSAALLDHRSDAASHATALELAKRFASSDQPALLDTLGWAYYRNGDYKRARQYLEIAVKPGDQHPLVHHHLGMAYFAVESLMPARRQLMKAIDLAEGDYSQIDEANQTLDAILALMKPR